MARRLCVSLLLIASLLATSVDAQRSTRRVFVTVLDRIGAPVLDLTPAEFQVWENGHSREVKRATRGGSPMRIVLLVDASISTATMLTDFRNGLKAFLDAIPEDAEIVFATTGGQLRIRVPPTTDRQKLYAAAARYASDGGANVFLDALLETNQRFFKKAPDRWPVFAILTTDLVQPRGEPQVDEYNYFVNDFIARGGRAHVLLIRATNTSMTTEIASNLARNTGGLYDAMAIANSLPTKMQVLANRIAADRQALADGYEIEYIGDEKVPFSAVTVDVSRGGVTLRVSGRRSF